jgi:hypothetical protein
MIFVSVNNIENTLTRDDGRTGKGETQINIPAISTFENGGDLAFVGEAASLAKWGIDESDLRAAAIADEAFGRRCARATAHLADFGINES